MDPPLSVIWANTAVHNSGNLIAFRLCLPFSFYCTYLCNKLSLNYLQTGKKNRNTDTIQSREYWIGDKIVAGFNYMFSLSFHRWVTYMSSRILKGSLPSKPSLSVFLAQGWGGCSLLIMTAVSVRRTEMHKDSSRNQVVVKDTGSGWVMLKAPSVPFLFS